MNQKYIILYLVVIMIAGIYILDRVFRQSNIEAVVKVHEEHYNDISYLQEDQVFTQQDLVNEFVDLQSELSERTIKEYHVNRAFHGAPPFIPHEVDNEGVIGGSSCLQCHGKGGYVSMYKAYAPIAPHPDYLSCLQCHVPKKINTNFKGISTTFEKSKARPKVVTPLPGSPQMVPHSLKDRAACLSCHGGPSAPKEIRVSHPERINCLQCHVVNEKNSSEIWVRNTIAQEK